MSWRRLLETVSRDLRYAVRRLGKNPAFAIVTSLSLALGIGLTTAAFSVLYAVLLRALPVDDPASLAVVSTRNAGARYSMSHAAFVYLRDHVTSLEAVSFRAMPLNVNADAPTDRVTGMLVSGNYFRALGVPMALGSPVLPDDDRVPGTGGPRGVVAVLGYEYWTRRFDAEQEVVGRVIRVNGQPCTIVGVAPRDFNGTRIGSLPSIFLPMMFAPHAFEAPNWLSATRSNWLRIMGRLAPGVTLSQAEAEMTTAFRRFQQDVIVPLSNTDAARKRAREASIVLEPGYSGLFELDDDVRPTLFSVMGLVALVLVIACVNIAGLMAARGERLHRETAICLALGATRFHLWCTHLVETLLVAAVGIGLGVVLATSMLGLFTRLLPADLQLRVAIDANVLAAAMVLGLLVAIVLAAVAAGQSSRARIGRALKGEDVVARLWLRKGLIVAQFALSAAVLAAAALFGQTVSHLRRVDPGFEQHRVLIASIAPAGYLPAQRKALYARLLDEVRTLPGVVSAAVANDEPLSVRTGWTVTLRGDDGAPRQADATVSFISTDYFKTMGISLVRGRDFTPGDDTDPSRPVIVNENFVRHHLKIDDPLGVRFTSNVNLTYEIVGVVHDSAAVGLRARDEQMLYVPGGDGVLFLRDAVLHVRTSVSPATLQPSIEKAVHRLDPNIPVFNVRTIEQQLDRFVVRERTFAMLSSTFGAAALVLCAVGLYGVVAHAVNRRTKELAIRLALGAVPRKIFALIFREAGALAALGILIGVPCALLTGRAIRALLFGVQPGDWKSATIAVAILLIVTAMAAWIPARRAARTDPLAALRAE